jgi:uncharacterized surface protein with fasciclin (FAS1) repeats
MEDVNMNIYTLRFIWIYSLMFLLAVFTTSGYAAEKGRNNLPAFADTTDGSSVLSAALEASGFDATPHGNKHYTVLASTVAAFLQSLKNRDLTPEQLLSQPELVATVLKFHVARGNRYASGLIGAGDLKVPDRNDTPIAVTAKGATIEDAVITTADLRARNAVIHTADQAIIPPRPL